jgi:hypothetical protein
MVDKSLSDPALVKLMWTHQLQQGGRARRNSQYGNGQGFPDCWISLASWRLT